MAAKKKKETKKKPIYDNWDNFWSIIITTFVTVIVWALTAVNLINIKNKTWEYDKCKFQNKKAKVDCLDEKYKFETSIEKYSYFFEGLYSKKTNKMVTDEEVKKGDYGFLNAMKMAFSESIAVPRVVNNFILNKLLSVFKQSNKITNPNERHKKLDSENSAMFLLTPIIFILYILSLSASKIVTFFFYIFVILKQLLIIEPFNFGKDRKTSPDDKSNIGTKIFKDILYLILALAKPVLGYAIYILVFPIILLPIMIIYNVCYNVYALIYSIFGDFYNRGWNDGMGEDITSYGNLITGIFGIITILYSIPFVDNITLSAMLVTFIGYSVKIYLDSKK